MRSPKRYVQNLEDHIRVLENELADARTFQGAPRGSVKDEREHDQSNFISHRKAGLCPPQSLTVQS